MPLSANITREEFYKERDARTSLTANQSLLAAAKIAVSIDPDEAQKAQGHAAFLLAVNLMSRWCRSLLIVAPDIPIHPALGRQMGTSLNEAALAIATKADPFGEFAFATRVPPDVLGVHVGKYPASGEFPLLGRSWLALAGDAVNKTIDGDDSTNLLGSQFAACIGVAYAFRRVLGHRKGMPTNCMLSLWNLAGGDNARQGPALESPELGRVLMVGTGGIGSAVCYFLPFIQPEITAITLLDGDLVEISNLNRSPLFIANDVDLSKAEVAANHLRTYGLLVNPLGMWFDEAIKSGRLSVNSHDVILPLANERGVVHSLQEQVPPLAVYGTTGENWDIFLGRHIPLKEDCLACRFPAPATEPKLTCSIGFLAEPGASVKAAGETGALPFTSSAAALLACAELAKLAFSDYPFNSNYACLGFRGPLLDFLTVPIGPSLGCTRCPHKAVWSQLNGGSQFANLSF